MYKNQFLISKKQTNTVSSVLLFRDLDKNKNDLLSSNSSKQFSQTNSLFPTNRSSKNFTTQDEVAEPGGVLLLELLWLNGNLVALEQV